MHGDARRGGRWVGHRYPLGSNKDVFGAETYAIFGALGVFEDAVTPSSRTRRQPSTEVGTDAIGPGQQWARAATEACPRAISRDNQVTILRVPAHSGIAGNEADRLVKEAAEGQSQEVPDEVR